MENSTQLLQSEKQIAEIILTMTHVHLFVIEVEVVFYEKRLIESYSVIMKIETRAMFLDEHVDGK